MDSLKFGTIAVTGSYLHDSETGATSVPIYMTNAYQFKDADTAANLFDLKAPGYIYTRLHNPTTDVLEKRIAALEGGVAAVATASGQFAELLIFSTLCKSGDEIVASAKLYGGTLNLLGASLARFGIKTNFVEQRDLQAWERAINENTKALYIETLANPDNSIPDFEAFGKLAAKYNIPLVVDNTMSTPFLIKPVDFGANVVIHSTTKYLTGNNSAMGGIVVDLGNFNWKSGRFNDFCNPDPSYHGTVFADEFGSAALAVRMRTTIYRDFGGTPSPFNSFLTLIGLQTLHLRMPQHVSNARETVKFLLQHKNVEDVSFPELETHPDNKLCKKYFPKGAGSLLTFKVKGGYENAKKFIESLKLCVHATNVGDARTIITHPASTTHRQASEEGLKKAGITKNLIRVSVGIEDSTDIIADLKQALDSIK